MRKLNAEQRQQIENYLEAVQHLAFMEEERACGDCVSLEQPEPDDTIEIDLDLDELDATSAETKATYHEIKDYVLKEFGLKVSNLYISQIKRK